MNNYQRVGQIKGFFNAGDEIIDMIKLNEGLINSRSIQFTGLIHIGIQAEPSSYVIINNKTFEIGKTGILEIQEGINITSIVFKYDTKSIIDYSYV